MNSTERSQAESRRLAVAELIANGADPSAFAETLRDPDWRVREEAILRIRTFGRKQALVPVLIEALAETADIAFRNAAAAALGMVGSSCLSQLERALPPMDEDARKLVAEICAQIPTRESVALLLRLAEDPDENVRIAAFEALRGARDTGPAAADEAAALILRGAVGAGPALCLAALDALYALGKPIGCANLRAWADDPLLGPYAARAATGSADPATLDLLATLAGRGGDVAAEAIRALARSLPLARSAVFFAVSRHGGALCAALEGAIRVGDERTRAAALDLLPAVFRPEHLSLYVAALTQDATADAAARGLATLAPMVGGHLLISEEYIHMEGLPIAARIVAPQLDEASSVEVSRRLLLDPPSVLVDVFLDVLLLLPVWAPDVSWERVFEGANAGDFEQRASELIALRAEREPPWARAELARTKPREHRARVRAALLLGVARSEPLSTAETQDVEVGIGSEDALVRASSLQAAAHGAAVDHRTVISALADESNHVVVAAIGAAARAGCFLELEELAVATTDAQVLLAALSALASVAPQRVPVLVERRLASGDERLAAAALSRLPPSNPRLAEICEFAITRGEVPVVVAALRLLAACPDPRARDVTLPLLEHERWEVRALAASGLSASTHRDVLLARLEREDNTTVAEAIKHSLRGT